MGAGTVQRVRSNRADVGIMIVTMAITAAPAPASAHTNRWKVKSSWNAERLHVIIIIIFISSGGCTFFVMQNSSLLPATFWPTSLDSHILKNFSDPVHTFLSSEIVTAPDRITNTESSCCWESTIGKINKPLEPGCWCCKLHQHSAAVSCTNNQASLEASQILYDGVCEVSVVHFNAFPNKGVCFLHFQQT